MRSIAAIAQSALLVIVVSACSSTLPVVAVVANAPDRLAAGSAGTLAQFDSEVTAQKCSWYRVEPHEEPVLVHEFPHACVDADLHWTRDASRALLIAWDDADEAHVYDVDLARHTLASVPLPPRHAASLGFTMGDDALAFLTLADHQPNDMFRRRLAALGLVEDCVFGGAFTWRSRKPGEWREHRHIPIDCQGGLVGAGELGDFDSWKRPGVVNDPEELPDGIFARRGVRRRGGYAIVPEDPSFVRIASERGIGGELFATPIEFWPAPVDPAWEKIAAQPDPQTW